MTQTSILVVYYSDTGHTRDAARNVAAALDATLEEIKATGLRRGLIGFFQRGRLAMAQKPAQIQPPHHDPADFDLVVVGTPVWGWHLCGPVRAYLQAYSANLSKVAYLITTGGQGVERTTANMTAITGKDPVASVAITDDDRKTGNDHAKVEAFIEQLRQA